MEGIGHNPIRMRELEAFKRSLKPGDKLIYMERAVGEDGIKGGTAIKRVMEVEKVHRYTIDLRQGGMRRNVTLKEALIWNRKAPKAMAQKTGYSRKGIDNLQRALRKKLGRGKEA